MKRACLLALIPILGIAPFLHAQATVTVRLDQPGAALNPKMFGIFFEDINFAADGGIYPERIKNGSFEFEDPMMGWRKTERGNVVGGFGTQTDQPLNANNPKYMRIVVERAGDGIALTNDGYRGMPIAQGAKYTFSIWARSRTTPAMSLGIELVAANNSQIAAVQEISGITGEWKKYSCTIEATAADPRARLHVVARGTGVLDIDMVSLFPQETFMNRPNGLRPDLANLLKDLKPGFIRFPGGCIVEGRVLEQRYDWKKTIGPLEERKLIINRWNVEFAAPRNAPDYYQSFGLGFFEYFQFCEDIGAEPMPILNCGMACQFNLGELVPLDQLGPYIQDVIDLIEFANGPVTSTWGAKRAAMGHPAPFNLKMVGIGNEQWGQQYVDRYAIFHKALKEKHPEIKLISGVGPDPSGPRFDFLWSELRKLKPDIVDEHFYRPPQFFYQNVNRYDNYPRDGVQVFAGEFAAHTSNNIAQRRNNWTAALAEASMMTGIERNGDIVTLSSYAPLLANVDAWQWQPNMIWFDGTRSMGTPNYYVQKLYATNAGTRLLPITVEAQNAQVYGSAVLDERTNQAILKIVNATPEAQPVQIKLPGNVRVQPQAQVQTLGSPDLAVENSLDEPTKIAPVAGTIDNAGAEFTYPLSPNSMNVIRLMIVR